MEPYLYFGSLGAHERQYQIPNFTGLALEPKHGREIKHDLTQPLPYPDNSIAKVQAQDVLEHLAFDKVPFVLDEIYRVLKSGGRLAVSDMAWAIEPAASLRKDMEALVGCIGGALVLDDYVSRLRQAGFACVEIEKHAEAARKMVEVSGTVPPPGIEHLLSVNITATK